MITGILIGIATTAFVIYVAEHISSYFRYTQFKGWASGKGIDLTDMDKERFSKYYALWQLSQMPNVEIEQVDKE